MKVLVIGSGGREHCLVWKLSRSDKVDKIYCAPGNGGTALCAENVDIAAEALDKLCVFAKEKKIDLTVVGPEVPLVRGIVDLFEKEGLRIFGPRKELAGLEGSKIFAKELMQKCSIPTASFRVFDDYDAAREYIKDHPLPLVIKADGLAAGKGVMICNTLNEATGALDLMMQERIFGRAGDKVIIEECLTGEEVSFLVLTDGKTVLPLVSSQDYKRARDGDSGLNTGGMGAYSPVSFFDAEMLDKVINEICLPLMQYLDKEGKSYKGVLYLGLMIKEGKPCVLEFNVRFGDPETQAILPKLKNDLAELMLKTVEGDLSSVSLEWDDRFSLCVVLASGGYPGSYEKGKLISGLESFQDSGDISIFHAGTKLEPKGPSGPGEKTQDRAQSEQDTYARALAGRSQFDLVTCGGRVLAVSGLGRNPEETIALVYSAVKKIKFDGMYYRNDIGRKTLPEDKG